MPPSDRQLRRALDAMILSASGWRKVFAPNGENGFDPRPGPADQLLAAAMGMVWGRRLGCMSGFAPGDESLRTSRSPEVPPEQAPRVLTACDTRPTGPILAEMVMRGLEDSGCRPVYVGVAAAPEVMARSARDRGIAGFAYVSASHNPVGHNGFKFGVRGGVLGGKEAASLIAEYRKTVGAPGAAAGLMECAGTLFAPPDLADAPAARRDALVPDVGPAPPGPCRPRMIRRDARVRGVHRAEKRRCLEIYTAFLRETAGGGGTPKQREAVLSALRRALEERPLRVIADLNGSARCLSADRAFLNSLGVELTTFNDEPGRIAHTIIPEGESLEPCRRALEETHAEDPAAVIGYVPDNDGDRGNLVIWDDEAGRARSLEAQEVFALSALAELALDSCPPPASDSPPLTSEGAAGMNRSAIVVNGPTSHRVRVIAAAYGAEVHETEVGEANVTGRADALRKAGLRVRLLGEGSNGGTIIHPAAVRDPLNTLAALIKLLRLPGGPPARKAALRKYPWAVKGRKRGTPARKAAPFEDWCRRSGRMELYAPDFGISRAAASLPAFTTTPSSAPRAVMTVKTRDHAALKAEWERIFRRQWSLHKDELRRKYGFTRWTEFNNEGGESRRGMGPEYRSGAESGGLKIVFSDSRGEDAGFLWMRGSGTEPVFRVMAEIRGVSPAGEEALVMWQRGMTAAADRAASSPDSPEPPIPAPFAG